MSETDYIAPFSFTGRKLVVATMHNKEQVIAPLLVGELGVDIVAATGFDTDRFGTFTGEVEREKDPLSTARSKCRAAAERTGCTLAVASEGSFGPHPSFAFAAAGDEIVLMLDLEHNLEFKARVLTTETNFSGSLVTTWAEAKRFAESALFPSHGLIARRTKDEVTGVVKGIRSWKHLEEVAAHFLSANGNVYLETDMRAMHNPTRMKTIAAATRKLLVVIAQGCPHCATPGFDVRRVLPGLPCELCGSPTRSTLAYVRSCQVCNHEQVEQYPNKKTHESPMYCDWCNP